MGYSHKPGPARRARLGAVLLCGFLLLSGCGPAAGLPQGGADGHGSQLSASLNRDPYRALIEQSHDAGPLRPDRQVSFVLLLKYRTPNGQPSSQARDLASMYDPHSPAFGHFKTARQFETSYGPRPDVVRRIGALLRHNGLRMSWQQGNSWLTVFGPAGRVERSFGVRLHEFVSPGGATYYAGARNPSIPVWLRPWVAAAGHISSYVTRHADAVPPGGLTPTGLLRAYDIQPLRKLGLDGSGETVVFFELDGYRQSALNAWTQKFNLAPIHPVTRLGAAPQPDGETEMDLEVVHAIAPGARLVIYNCGSSDCATESDELRRQSRMVRDNPGAVMSQSWSECDRYDKRPISEVFKRTYDEAAALGESVFASTGDSGAFECLKSLDTSQWGTPPSPSSIGAALPASAPGVTAVGGTRLSVRTDGRWYDETVWEEPARTTGSGGAPSAYFAMPAWQRGPGVRNSQYNPGNRREIPDISADADGASGAAIYTTSGGSTDWSTGGGTSQSAPIWAAITVLINQYLKRQGLRRIGFMNPALYALARTRQPYPPFHDITIGTNLYYPATPGYDLATGLGSPDAWNLARDLKAYLRGGR